MKVQTATVLLCFAPPLLAGLIGQPWADAAALLWPGFLIVALIIAFAIRALRDLI